MNTLHIFQVIDIPSKYKEITFLFKGEKVKTKLSSVALKQYLEKFKGEKVKITFFIPESSVFGLKDGEIKSELMKAGIDKDVTFVRLPSLGRFKISDEIEFLTNIGTIVSTILITFIKSKAEKFIIDTSTGHNIYPVLLLDAAKRYITYLKLKYILQENKKVEAHTTFLPPVTKTTNVEYKLEKQPIKAKAFFSLPTIKSVDILDFEFLNNEWKSIKDKFKLERDIKPYKEKWNRWKNDIKSLLKELKIAFNSLTYSIPLSFYQILTMEINEEELEKVITNYVEEIASKYKKVGNVVIWLPINDGNLSNILYSIALYHSIKKFYNELSENTVSELEEFFLNKLYKKSYLSLKANEHFLGNELRKLRELVERNKDHISTKGEVLYGELISNKNSKNETNYKNTKNIHGSSDIKRNFFAHCGFLKEYTYVKLSNEKIYIKWDKEKIGMFKKWLK